MTYDALVIGAGPAGSMAALQLASAGWSVALVEKSEFPRRKVCGEFISATSLALLRHAGIDGDFTAAAGPYIREVALFAGDKIARAPMPRGQGANSWGRALGRESLDTLLRDKALASGARLFQPCKLFGIENDAGIYHATLEDADGMKQVQARLVIEAGGSWEKGVLSDFSRPHWPSDLLAFKAHFHGADLPGGLMPLLVFPGGYGGMVSTDNERVSLSCCIERDALATCRAAFPNMGAGQAVLSHIQAHNKGVRKALRHSEVVGAVLSAGPIRPGMRVSTGRPGHFRVGNAAGEAHPIIAEGISMAMQSSFLLCRRLLEGGTLHKAAIAYERDWRAQFSLRIRAAAFFAAMALKPKVSAAAASLIETLPSLLTLGARLSGKTLAIKNAPSF